MEDMNTQTLGGDTPVETPEGGETAKTYTQEEVDKLVQQQADRRVSQALKTQQAKFEAQMSEAEKLRQMNDEQKAQYEFDKQKAEFEEQKREFALLQNKLEATKVLEDRGLPVVFADYIVNEDAETMMSNIETFEKAFKASVADAVNARIASPAPRGNSAKQTGLTPDDFKKLTLAQKQELYTSNPTLYKQMIGG